MRFIKMHGTGNDYVYVNAFAERLPADLPALTRAISDRHFGVGSDGLIAVLPSEVADARMRMFNADGSESEMCGNGLRCVAKLVHDHGIARKPSLTIETGRGVLAVELEVENGQAARARVDMGRPILTPAEVPTTLPATAHGAALEVPLELPGVHWAGAVSAVSTGNPHAVVFVEPEFLSARPRDRVAEVGAALETHPAFPRRANAHFVAVTSESEVTIRTWERGAGLTLACGTGACAVAVAGVLTGRTGAKLLAHLPGGDLTLEWAGGDAAIFMTGPAVEVFGGDWPA